MPGPKLIAADAFVNPEHFRFALKGCFAVSACYVIYDSIDWPGIGVPVMLTCFLTAVSTIGASRQRQILSFAGFVVGPPNRHERPGVPFCRTLIRLRGSRFFSYSSQRWPRGS
jgi:hypothetical protein